MEFALCLPVFLVMTCGIFDFAWFARYWTGLNTAAINGCRTGSTRDPGLNQVNINSVLATTRSAIEAAATNQGLDCGTCTISVTKVGLLPEESLDCSVTLDGPPLTGLVMSELTLHGNSVARMEFQR
jgi:Flp pilus assembly protein TadG